MGGLKDRRRGAGLRAKPVGTKGIGLLLAGYAALLAVWVFTNPPGMSVDEPAHYRKAVALSHGDVLGAPDGYTALPVVTGSELAWLNRNTRSLTVPTALRGCDAFRLPVGGRCPADPVEALQVRPPAGQELSYVATYPPIGYVVPAVGTRIAAAAGGHTTAALYAGRAAAAAVCVGLLAGTLACMVDGAWAPSAVVGVALAVSPMAVFLMAQLSTSGAEVAGAACTFAAGLCLTRSPADADAGAATRSRRVPWVALAAGGWCLATSRSLGPEWVVMVLALVWILRGTGSVRAAVLAYPRAARACAAVVAAGMILTTVWTVLVEPRPHSSLSVILGGVGPALRQVPSVAVHGVGIFGWVDVHLPQALTDPWILLVAVVFLGAVAVGSTRDRVALALAAAGALAATIVVSAAVIRPTSPDFEMQGRYVLPALVVVPLLAAEVLGAHRRRVAEWLGARGTRAAAGVVVAVTVVVQALAWGINGRKYGVGSIFDGEYRRAWRPAGGWWPWAAAVVVALAVVAAASARVSARTQVTAAPDVT